MTITVLLGGSDRLSAAIERRLLAAGCRVSRLGAGGEADESLLEATSVLVLAADDDPGNVDAALTARRLRPGLPLVVRLFDETLAEYLKHTLDAVTILSMSGISAPVFAEATLQTIAARSDVPGPPQAAKPTIRSRRPVALDRFLVGAGVGLFALIVFSTLFFADALGLPLLDALYFVWTTVTTTGYGDISLRNASSLAKIVGMALMFSGAAFIAVLFGIFTDWVVTRRLDLLRGRVRARARGHLVIAGGGNVGFRAASLLQEKGYRLVAIERDPESRNIEALRALGHHVIVADAARDDSLAMANVEQAAAVLALTDSDAVNLHIALLVRARHAGVPVIMRLVSPELSAHVSEHGDAIAISPIAVAADEFARAALSASGSAGRSADAG